MKNKLVRSINPININVSYNNPVALNGFNNPDTNMNKYSLQFLVNYKNIIQIKIFSLTTKHKQKLQLLSSEYGLGELIV